MSAPSGANSVVGGTAGVLSAVHKLRAYPRAAALCGGETITIRPLEPADEDALLRFFLLIRIWPYVLLAYLSANLIVGLITHAGRDSR